MLGSLLWNSYLSLAHMDHYVLQNSYLSWWQFGPIFLSSWCWRKPLVPDLIIFLILIKPSALTWVYILEMIETWVQFWVHWIPKHHFKCFEENSRVSSSSSSTMLVCRGVWLWSPIWVLALGKGYLHNVVQVSDLAGGWPVLDLEPTHDLEPQEKRLCIMHMVWNVLVFFWGNWWSWSWKFYESWMICGWMKCNHWMKWKMMDQRINFSYITLVFKKSQANQITFYNVIDSLSIISWKLSSFWRFSSNWRFFDSENF